MNAKISKAKIKWVRSLQQKKYRDLHGCYQVAGYRACLDLLATGVIVREMIVDEKQDIDASWPVTSIASSDIMKQLTSWVTAPTMLLVLDQRPTGRLQDLDTGQRVSLYLDTVQDPGNVGTIMRTCSWFGCKQLILGPGCADPYGPKTIQAAMGAQQHLQLVKAKLGQVKSAYPQLHIAGLTMSGGPISSGLEHTKNPLILCLGNEGNGLSTEALNCLDQAWTIPGVSDGSIESLNVASAAAIALYAACELLDKP